MKRALPFLLVFITCSLYGTEDPNKFIGGVFGVCDCQSKPNSAKLIELTLNEDSSFTYVDNTDPSRKSVLQGKWIAKGRKVQLTASDNRKDFHHKWRMTKDGQCIKSRYKLNFRRICLANKLKD